MIAHNRIDMTGKKYGRLTVIKHDETNDKFAKWLCLCDCGNTKSIIGNKLRSGNTKSCGCYRKEKMATEKTTHGMTNTFTYRCWMAMIRRCSNPNHDAFKYYGGRGIKVCNEWLSFDSFFKDMGEKPEGLEIDRIETNGNYEPLNCRWATHKENCNNRRKYNALV